MAAELKVATRMLRDSSNLFHFLYGETTYHYSGLLSEIRKNKLIGTFHLPPSGIQHSFSVTWPINNLSAIICVGTNQMEYFSRIVNKERIFFVPHGVDTDFYLPPDSFHLRDPDLCLIVGDNYRDFPTLRGVIELVSYIRPKTRFVCVMPPKNYPLIGTHPNLDLRSGIPEEELLSLYQAASLMVMPLHDATANNAVLESMACGLPIVISDIGAVRDYVNPASAELLPPYDARCMAESICNLLDDPHKRIEMGIHARNRALKFTWSAVVEQLNAVYRSLE
jgi:glycosyltransferase involved in cell wall biosynthesis